MTTKPTWLFLGDEFLQEMYRYLRPPIAERVVGDVIGSKDSTYASWLYAGGAAELARGSRSGIQIYVDEVKPDATIILLGTNPGGDIPVGFTDQVTAAVAQASRWGGQVVLVGPFGNDASGKRLAAMRRIVPDTIDGSAMSAGLPRGRDGLHLTLEGYRVLIERIIPAVFQVLERRTPKDTTVSVTDTDGTDTVTVTPVEDDEEVPGPLPDDLPSPPPPPPPLPPPPPPIPGTPAPGIPQRLRISVTDPGGGLPKTEPGVPPSSKSSRWPWIIGIGVVVAGTALFLALRKPKSPRKA